MNLPEGVSEEEFVEIVERIGRRLCDKFKFGYYSREDIQQECFIEAIDGLERYDKDRPLENFLWRHVHNRLCNLKRNKYFRLEKPCYKCPLNAYRKKDDFCMAYDDKSECKPYRVWLKKNTSKQNIMNPVAINILSNESSEKNMAKNANVSSDAANREILDIIDSNISLGMRKIWLQQKAGIKVNKKNYDILMEEIEIIMEDNNIDVSKTW